MRWFWGLLAVAAIAAVMMMVMRREAKPGDRAAPPPAPPPPAREVAAAPAQPVPLTLTPPDPTPHLTPSGKPISPKPSTEEPPPAPAPVADTPAPPPTPSALKPAPTDAPVAKAPQPVAPDVPEIPKPAPAPKTSPAGTEHQVTSALVGPPEPSATDRAAEELKRAVDTALGLRDSAFSNGELTNPKPASSGAAEADAAFVGPPAPPVAAKAKLIPRDDGTTLVDDRFVIKGAGTNSDPYLISWEMLVSAQESYQPRLGRKLIPDRLKMLDGKWIRIAGYIAFPIMAQSQDEMLMMLNQWDGCCIGVPPTPYDAIEVKLGVPAKGDDRLRVSGSVTGILRVDPYLVKDWLVSLYLMDDAELKVDGGEKRDPLATPGHKAPE